MSLQPCAGVPAYPWLGVDRQPCGRPTTGNRCPDCAARHAALDSPTYDDEYQANRRQVLAEEDRCWICKQPPRPGNPLTADHVTPAVHGGSNARSNLRAAHLKCNSRRGADDR